MAAQAQQKHVLGMDRLPNNQRHINHIPNLDTAFFGHGSTKQLSALYKDIVKIDYLPDQIGYEITEYFSDAWGYGVSWECMDIIYVLYIGSFLLTVLCVIFDELLPSPKNKYRPLFLGGQ